MRKRMSDEQKRTKHTLNFFKHVQKGEGPEDCWLWTGRCNNGYGRFDFMGKGMSAHVASLLIHSGMSHEDIPEDPTNPGFKMSGIHKCPNKNCVHPLHVKFGTNRENTEDKRRAGTAKWGRCRPRVPDEVVAQAIQEFIETDAPGWRIADKYGIRRKGMSGIIRGDIYRGVLPDVSRPIQRRKAS